jgi:hypothetical protein
MGGLEQRARAHDADLMTLTTEVVYGAWRLYSRWGFQILETYQPLVRPIVANLPPRRPNETGLPVTSVSRKEFAAAFTPGQGRSLAIVELWSEEPAPPEALRPRYFCAGDAAIATLQWPVMSRSHTDRVAVQATVHATQILRLQGQGPALEAVLAEATRMARLDESVCIYALPTVAQSLPGFHTRGAPVVHRMVKPLTALGETAIRQARAWDEICPAP